MEIDLDLRAEDDYDDYDSDDEDLVDTESRTIVVSESQLEGTSIHYLSIYTNPLTSTSASYFIRIHIATFNTYILPITRSSHSWRTIMYTYPSPTRCRYEQRSRERQGR